MAPVPILPRSENEGGSGGALRRPRLRVAADRTSARSFGFRGAVTRAVAPHAARARHAGRATPGGRCQAAGHRTCVRATALSADFGGNRRGEEHHCDLPCYGGLFLGHTEAAGKARRRSLEATRRLLHIAWTAAPMHDHANALPSPSRFKCAKADFDAFVAERCEMISSLVNRLCDGAPRKAGDGPTWSASAN